MSTERTDEELVTDFKEAAEGDKIAFETLVERHRTRVMANCRYISGSQADAEDLAQEVFVKAYFGLERFEGRASFKTWIQRIKVNHCLNHVRKRAGKSFVEIEDLELKGAEELQVAPKAEKNVAALGMRERIDEALEGLTDTLRIPLVMRDMDHLPYQEIADTLGIGLSAVKMRIKRARAEFQKRYTALEEG